MLSSTKSARIAYERRDFRTALVKLDSWSSKNYRGRGRPDCASLQRTDKSYYRNSSESLNTASSWEIHLSPTVPYSMCPDLRATSFSYVPGAPLSSR